MTIENWCDENGPDAERRACVDCGWLRGALHWWCMSEEAKEYRGTTIPGVHDCPFWKPAGPKKKPAKLEQKIKTNKYLTIILIVLLITMIARLIWLAPLFLK